ncbi:protein associated with UVRAG as autophagy enhancer isoform X1 [Seriola aureovittata]|uniref:protein associated with UVRAG as autophagy enhancer isoform X1 n=1 Tax=Seriola aureovittata TaxID=2871759 RepID=UPI0024BDE539|nr:protein associated with UVRAG as autophagy enhancer isoform X1 [Seriola aureovittata]
MGTCRGVSSSVCRSGYVSWCVDSLAESPTPDATAPTATVSSSPEQSSHPKHQSAGSGSIPVLLLSPPEPTCSRQPPQTTSTERTQKKNKAFVRSHPSRFNAHSSSASHNTDKATNSHSEEGEDDESEEGRREAGTRRGDAPSLLHPEVERTLLPRSSPVISRRHRPVSWHGGEADTSDPSSLDSPSPAAASLSQDQRGRPTVASLEDLGSKPSSGQQRSPPLQEDKRQRCVSVSSNLNNFLISLFHLPFTGQQGLAEEHKGQRLTGCDATRTPGLSTSAAHSKQRRHSGIPEFTDIFKTSCELEKENAHFIVVDMVLEVLEGVKWTLSSERRTSTTDTRRHTDCNMCTRTCTSSADDSRRTAHRLTQSCKQGSEISHRNTHSSHYVHTNQRTQEEEEEEEEEDTGNDEAEHQPKTLSAISSDSGFEDCGVDAALTLKDSLTNAEWLAQRLVLEFRRSWLPSHKPQRGRQSLRTSLQELPGAGSVAESGGRLTEEIRLRTRMRGSLSWAPPRFQIIFTVQPTPRRSEVVALQHFLCAGCGTEAEPRYIKKLRYCDYLGRYFCDCCHSGSEAVIPGRVLSGWDFSRYPVSDFSKQLLDSVWHQPLFDLSCVGKSLCSRAKELDKFRELQEQLLGIMKLLKACRLSASVMTEFEQLPAHLIFEQPPLFSMDDLLLVKKGQLVVQARAVLHAAISHVENCELCLARGFICEFCRDRDIIFPFQRDICRRCPVCKACFHKHCFVEKRCPKCARIQSRKKAQTDP